MLNSVILILTTAALCHASEGNCYDFLKLESCKTEDGKLTALDTHLSIATQILENARKKIHCDLDELCGKETCREKPIDCSDIYRNGSKKNGIYEIWPTSRVTKSPISVYCDMTSDDGGWTVIQRRGDFQNPNDNFFRDWHPYKTGFGDLMKDFWIGNDNLFALTNQRSYQLKIDLADWEGNSVYATYDQFWISDESVNYILQVGGYNGTAGDAMSYHNRMAFSTKDKDNDKSKKNCAKDRQGGWWYNDCAYANLNGIYLRGKISTTVYEGIHWKFFKGFEYSLKDTVMKIRPLDFDKNKPQ